MLHVLYVYPEPKFIVILWELKPAAAWVKVSSGMRLPMAILHEMSIQRHKVSSHPLPYPSLYL